MGKEEKTIVKKGAIDKYIWQRELKNFLPDRGC